MTISKSYFEQNLLLFAIADNMTKRSLLAATASRGTRGSEYYHMSKNLG
jgi:hypothetical protein